MLELEKKYWKDYRASKKEEKANNKLINENKKQFDKVFHYLINEYYRTFKKEFLVSEIANACNTNDIVISEIISFFKNKNITKCEKDKIIINYETIVTLNDIIKDFKRIGI